MKKIFTLACIAGSMTLLANEPFLLKKDNGSSFLQAKPESMFIKSKPDALFTKKKMAANADDKSNIAIKLNLTQLGLKNLSFQGEFGFHPKMSVALGFSYLLPNKLPGYSGDEYFGPLTYRGTAITPEFRFYPGGDIDKPAPNGFYIAAYLRYAKYKMTQDVSYTETDKTFNKTYRAETEQTYGGVNAGLMIGRQWIIGKHFSLDWWIIGGGYGKAKYTYKWMSPEANLSPADQRKAEQAAEENFADFSALGYSGKATATNNSVKMTVSGLPMMSIRFMGLCLGYAF